MAVKEIKDMGASVLTRLKKQAKETGINYQTCLQLFAQEEFLRKLEISRYAENLVLKGGMFLYTISNYEGRPTMDIDFMLRRMSNDIAGIESITKEICQTDTHNDFITMEVLGTREITPEKKYPGIGINLMAHIKNVRIPFSVDIGVDDVIVPGAVKRTVTTRLEGFKKPNIYTYSLESTMAEKFDAILKRMTATSRMKDFYDIYYWSQMFDFEAAGACFEKAYELNENEASEKCRKMADELAKMSIDGQVDAAESLKDCEALAAEWKQEYLEYIR